MRIRLLMDVGVVIVGVQLLVSCNAYFDAKEQARAERESLKGDEGLPIQILHESGVVDRNKEKDVGDVEDDLIVTLDVPELKGSQNVKVLREESRHNQIGRIEIEISIPYPQKLVGQLRIESLGKVDYLRYPVLIEGRVVKDKGEVLVSFDKYLPVVFNRMVGEASEGEGSPVVEFVIWDDGGKLRASTFLLYAELRVKVLDLKSGVDVLNPGDFGSIGVKEETVLLSNPLRITLR